MSRTSADTGRDAGGRQGSVARRGTIALHGGGEFQLGDEPFLAEILRLAAVAHAGDARPLPIAIIPLAAARGRPDLAGDAGVKALQRIATSVGVDVAVEAVPILDVASAADRSLVATVQRARLIHLPGGDPDIIPAVLRGSAALVAIKAALAGGAVLAGASAGAMAMTAWTWTAAGGTAGLDLVPGPPCIVMPHADASAWTSATTRFGPGVPDEAAILGLEERTGVLIDLGSSATWRVVGEGSVRWSPAGRDRRRPEVYRHGDVFRPGGP